MRAAVGFTGSKFCRKTARQSIPNGVGSPPPEEAEQSYRKSKEEYTKAYRNYYAHKRKDLDLKEYLIYWLEEIYTPRIANTTKVLANFVLYNLIIPKMNQSVKLKYVNAEYLDALLGAYPRLLNRQETKAANC